MNNDAKKITKSNNISFDYWWKNVEYLIKSKTLSSYIQLKFSFKKKDYLHYYNSNTSAFHAHQFESVRISMENQQANLQAVKQETTD